MLGMINITPACALNIHELDADINTINKWKDGSGGYRFWHFTGFCQAGYHLASKADELKDQASNTEISANKAATAQNNHKIQKQKEIDAQIDNHLNEKSTGADPNPPQTAIDYANEMKDALKPQKMNVTMDINVIGEPQIITWCR